MRWSMHSADVVVIGAGAMGSAAAWWLAREARHVVLLEQFEQGHARGSSHGGTRIFRVTYPDPADVALARAALAAWSELEADVGRTLVERTGGVDHGDAATIHALAAALDAAAAPYELLSPEAAGRQWPGMRFDVAVLSQPDGGRCLADRTLRALHDRAGELGADLRFAVGPASVRASGDGAVVRAGDQEWRAGAVVVTAGPWMAKVLADGGLAARRPPLRVVQDQVQHFRPRAGDRPGSWPSFVHHREPWHYGLATPHEGVKVACGAASVDVDPDARPLRDPRLEQAVVDYVADWLPGLDPTPHGPALCLSTLTPSRGFVVDRVGPIVIGSPCSGHGFKFTPLVGRLLADLALGRPGPERFRLPL